MRSVYRFVTTAMCLLTDLNYLSVITGVLLPNAEEFNAWGPMRLYVSSLTLTEFLEMDFKAFL